MYLDANNLYGWAMFNRWLTENEIQRFNIENIPDNSDDGYILEDDLSYPSELHDQHNDYPLAPEKFTVSPGMLTPYCRDLASDLKHKTTAVTKLVPNLQDRTHYVVHYRNLKQYLDLGMRLTKIHCV